MSTALSKNDTARCFAFLQKSALKTGFHVRRTPAKKSAMPRAYTQVKKPRYIKGLQSVVQLFNTIPPSSREAHPANTRAIRNAVVLARLKSDCLKKRLELDQPARLIWKASGRSH